MSSPCLGRPSNFQRKRQDGSALQAEYAMRALASDTGARLFFPKKVEELPAIYREIAHELANQYQVGTFRHGRALEEASNG